MAFSDNSVTRDNLDKYEGSTLDRFSSQTTLGLTDDDGKQASKAFTAVKLDLFDKSSRFYYNGDYSTKQDLLDDIDAADDEGLIEDLMALKFLELFFSDQEIRGVDSRNKAIYYENKYFEELAKNVTYLLANFTVPKTQNITKFKRY